VLLRFLIDGGDGLSLRNYFDLISKLMRILLNLGEVISILIDEVCLKVMGP
jgi:hypothetical protein